MMVNGPACPQCGYPLRWFAEQNAWGCDREQRLFPPHAVPHQAMPAQAAGGAAPGAPRRMSGAKLAIGALLLVGGIVAIAAVANGGGGKKTSGEYGDVLDRLRGFRDEICDCKDAACVHDVTRRMNAARDADHRTAKMSDEESHEMDQIFAEMEKCNDKRVQSTLPPAGTRAGDMLRELLAIHERACACTDKPCAKKVYGENDEWLGKYQPSFDSLPKDVRDQAIDVATDVKKCLDQAVASKATGASDSSNIAAWTTFRDNMCACRNATCANQVKKDMMAYAKNAPSDKPSAEDERKLDQLAKDIVTCSDRANE